MYVESQSLADPSHRSHHVLCNRYNCRQRNTIIALFRVPWVHDEKTPAIIDAWVRMNFSLKRQWERRIHRHLDELPALLPGKDQAQLLMG